jgi:radical SAM superfamily enzyme YgiQ (UPF0313 family)
MPGPQLADAVPLCRELKRRHPRLTVVWGGYFPSQHWQACLMSDCVDYVVRGHGEWVFDELLTSLEGGGTDPPRRTRDHCDAAPQRHELVERREIGHVRTLCLLCSADADGPGDGATPMRTTWPPRS